MAHPFRRKHPVYFAGGWYLAGYLCAPPDRPPAPSRTTHTTSYYPDVPGSTSSSSARTSLSGVSAVQEPRSPPPPADLASQSEYAIAPSDGFYPSPTSLGSMNHTQPYMDVHPHMSSAQPYASQGATASAMSHYQYPHQPPVLQPASSYAPSPYPQYGYPNGVTSPPTGHAPPVSSMGGQMGAQLLPLPQVNNHPAASSGYGNSTGSPLQGFVYDPTGQIAPPGAKPRVTATLWEDEGSLCYQVEAKGVCVARREDNHMINGTKLLNVAGMTRGRRDGILKSEKLRHVVKIGPMHLKGVWIPFERALEFANKEKITDLLYPLFVHNIGGLLYHPANQNRTNMVVQESQQRRLEGPPAGPQRTPTAPQPSSLHHHAMQTPMSSHLSQPSSMGGGPRPGLDRANTFPTPRLRSMPTTPATTPPGSNMQGMPPYQGQSAYDNKPYYSAAPQSHSHYAPQTPMTQSGISSYGQSLPTMNYLKNEMAPPTGRAPGAPETEPADLKSDRYAQSNGPGDAVPEHEPEYLQDQGSAYNGRGSYTYTTNPSVGSLTGEHSQLTPEMTGSPQQNGSGRMTPRTSVSGPPPDTRGTPANGASDPYSMASTSTPVYSTAMNGNLGSGSKRMREEDDVLRGDSGGEYESKRRKTLTDATLGGPVAPLLQPMKTGGVMARRR
ncbi:uncharacterized protein N7482_010291 [Penicillium canariense]|uniref:Cell pattern formation-associated protein STUA n=1 Tax=Penicillium canariense TaxID=189055 RepID=A0A9W9HL92_9EURO|nr:uncharacterized protein N7482_010291 [Penicillium canariense]KAJ5151039.1 hypothetical protein N7482_010291 [Penicillium canariense]